MGTTICSSGYESTQLITVDGEYLLHQISTRLSAAPGVTVNMNLYVYYSGFDWGSYVANFNPITAAPHNTSAYTTILFFDSSLNNLNLQDTIPLVPSHVISLNIDVTGGCATFLRVSGTAGSIAQLIEYSPMPAYSWPALYDQVGWGNYTKIYNPYASSLLGSGDIVSSTPVTATQSGTLHQLSVYMIAEWPPGMVRLSAQVGAVTVYFNVTLTYSNSMTRYDLYTAGRGNLAQQDTLTLLIGQNVTLTVNRGNTTRLRVMNVGSSTAFAVLVEYHALPPTAAPTSSPT
jgi:hypothetical protein